MKWNDFKIYFRTHNLFYKLVSFILKKFNLLFLFFKILRFVLYRTRNWLTPITNLLIYIYLCKYQDIMYLINNMHKENQCNVNSPVSFIYNIQTHTNLYSSLNLNLPNFTYKGVYFSNIKHHSHTPHDIIGNNKTRS